MVERAVHLQRPTVTPPDRFIRGTGLSVYLHMIYVYIMHAATRAYRAGCDGPYMCMSYPSSSQFTFSISPSTFGYNTAGHLLLFVHCIGAPEQAWRQPRRRLEPAAVPRAVHRPKAVHRRGPGGHRTKGRQSVRVDTFVSEPLADLIVHGLLK